MITREQLQRIAPLAKDFRITTCLPLLNAAMEKYEINTPLRVAHFLAQVLHESGSLRYTTELASGEANEGRTDLGNVYIGDGPRFKGRGLIQLTGRANYEAYGQYLGVRVVDTPELVSTQYMADAAGWFWMRKNLNPLADSDDIKAITKKVNGGYNGLADRELFLIRAKQNLFQSA